MMRQRDKRALLIVGIAAAAFLLLDVGVLPLWDAPRGATASNRREALAYVEEERPDGTGGGLLVRLHRRGKAWTITETDVLWVARTDDPGLESP